MIERKLIVRGVLAGAFAGLLAFVFARIFAEPVIARAIDYEGAREAAQMLLDRAAGIAPEAAGTDTFSRTVQAGVGLGSGLVVFGAALGGLFAVTYAICLGRVGGLRPKSLALLVGLAGFVTVFLVPFAKYPTSPPAASDDATIQNRGASYLLMVLLSVLLAIAAVWLGQGLKGRLGSWNASLAASAAFVLGVGVVMAVLPSFHETPGPMIDAQGTIVLAGFPADVLAEFRLYSVAAQALFWGVLSLVFAPLAERVLAPVTVDARRPVTVAVS